MMGETFKKDSIFSKKKVFLIANIIIPVIIGGFLYYMISPDVIFVEVIKKLLYSNGVTSAGKYLGPVGIFVRFYLLDMLWGYSLVFALYFCVGDDVAILKVFVLAFVFSIGMEVLQLIPVAPGFFDIWDIVVECIAEAIATLVLINFF